MNLYEITQEQKCLIAEIESMEGEITPEMEQALAITKEQLDQKSIAYLSVITNKEGFNALIDNEIKRLQAIKKRNDTLVRRLKENLLNAVRTFGEYEVGTHKFTTRKSSSKEFKVIKVTEQADKIALKKAIQEGMEIKGVELVEHLNLAIK